MEQYSITERAEFDKKYATIEGEENSMLNRLLQEARYVSGGEYWVRAVPKEVKYRDRHFPWKKHTYTDYVYILYTTWYNSDGDAYIRGCKWDYESLKWFFIGLSGGYAMAKKVNLVYNKETGKVEEVPLKE